AMASMRCRYAAVAMGLAGLFWALPALPQAITDSDLVAVTGQATTTTHMLTITATAVVTITAMPPKMVSFASQEQFSAARTAADMSASNEFTRLGVFL